MQTKQKQPLSFIKVFNERNEPLLKATFLIKKEKEQEGESLKVELDEGLGLYYIIKKPPGNFILEVRHPGYASEQRNVTFTRGKRQEFIFTLFAEDDEPEEYTITGGKRRRINPLKERRIVLKIKSGQSAEILDELQNRIQELGLEEIPQSHPDPSLKQYRIPEGLEMEEEYARRILEQEEFVEKAGTVIEAEDQNFTMLTDEITVKFIERATEDQIRYFLDTHNLTISRKLQYGINLYLLDSPSRNNRELLELSKQLVLDPLVENIDSNTSTTPEPDLINPNDFLAPEQWDHVNILGTPDAWQRLQNNSPSDTFGNLTRILAVCDFGTDVTHPDLSGTLSDGATNKVVQIYDFSNMAANMNNPVFSHGTNCSSAATSLANNNQGVAGIAGNAQLMAIMINPTGGGAADADMFEWVAGMNPQNGAFPPLPANGAEIISNSWGAATGNIHAAVNAAIDVITHYGRQGRGALIFFSSANGSQLYETQRPNGTHPRSMAIGATTLDNTGQNEIHAPYSNFGAGIEFSAPSHDQYPIVHNPTNRYGAFAATHRPNSPNPLAQTTVTGTTPPNTINVNNVNGFNNGDDIVVGPLGNQNSERFTINAIGINSFTLNRAWTNAPNVGDPVVALDGNCPGTNATVDSLTANVAVGANTIQINNGANFTAGNAVLIGNPGNPNSEAHAIQQVAGNTVTLMTNVFNAHANGDPVTVGSADYVNNFGGTSYATPVCAGIAGLCLSANPNLSWVEVRDILRHTGRKINIGDTGTVIGGVNIGKWRDENGQDIVNNAGVINSLNPQVISNLTNLNANRDLLTLASAADFEEGQAVVVTDGANTEFRVVDAVDTGANTITLDAPLNNNYPSPGTTVEAGRKPHYSAFYGYNRVHAGSAVQAALDSVNNYRQLVIRNNLADTGSAASADIQSPDIWISNDALVTNDRTYTLKRSAVGLDDFSFNQDYTGDQNAEFHIEIANTGPTDQVTWRMNDGPVQGPTNIPAAPATLGLSNNLTVQFGATTGHKQDDSWTLYIDQKETGLDYTKDAPHENPETGTNRFIHARIKNLVTGPMAQDFKNLDAWVRFYIVLSSGKTANANAQGAGFTSNFFFSSNGNNNDWDDTNPVNTITGGATQTYFVGEVEIPEGVIDPPDDSDPDKGTYIVSIPWNQADIPPAATADNIYVLVHIAPFHGPLNGTGAHNNSCLAYREIAFADFTFMDQARVNDLVSEIEVDAFGNSETQDFSVDIEQHIGTFSTEKLKLEVVRINDNGTEEKAIFFHDGANWTFEAANPQWNGLTINAPILTGAGGAAAGNQTNVSFQGNFQVAKEHQRVVIRPKITSKHADQVIATDSHLVDVIEQEETPTGIDPKTLAAPPPPLSHAFADMANLSQTANQAYGPVNGQVSNQFRITSLFTATTDTHAYAVTNGIVFLQPGADANTVNLVLRPFKQPIIGFTPVKYFIYRSLRKADFLDPADETKIISEDPSNSEFIKRQREIHKDQNDPGDDFLSKSMGYDPGTQSDSDLLDEFFFNSNPDFQLPFANRGMELGQFHHQGDHEFGIEVILEEGTYEVDLGQVKKGAHIIDVSGMPSGSDAEKFDLRLAREEILNFIDPSAFYGIHVERKGTVETRKLIDGSTEKQKNQDIYTHVVDVFHTKNRVYLDVRNENGNSYNFYQNYVGDPTDSDHGMSIQLGTEYTDPATNNLAAREYATHDWPLLMEDRAQNVSGDTNLLYCSFRVDDNIKPLMYVESGTPNNISIPLSPHFMDPFDLGVSGIDSDSDWTRAIGFDLANTGPANARLNIASIVKLIYNRSSPYVRSNWPTTVLRTDSHTDNIFGPLHLTPLWETDENIKWITTQDKRFVDFTSLFGYMAERGVSVDGFSDTDPSQGRLIMFAVANEYYIQVAGYQPVQGITGGVSTKGTFFEAADFFHDLKLNFDVLKIGGTSVTTLQLTPTSGKALAPNSVLLLCISREEWNTLSAVGGFHDDYDRYIELEQVEDTTDDNNKSYKKYKLKVQGLDSDGKYTQAAPSSDVFVYSIDDYMYFSDDFSKDEPLPTTYNRNAEENIGAQQNNKAGKSWEDFFIEKDTKGTLDGVNDNAKKIVEDFINDVNGVANDSNAEGNLATHIDHYGSTLLNRMRAYAENNNNNEADDRILYWSRIKMSAALKSHELLLQSFSARNKLIERLENKTRGYDDIDFSGAPGGTKKVLLTGFDPCFLDPKGGLTHNVLNSNPSGAAALALHGQTITDGANDVAYIQTLLLPVRYEDFDRRGGEGIVEDLFNRFLDPSDPDYEPVDMIIPMDKFTPHAFMFGRFAARKRGAEKDNRFVQEIKFPSLPQGEAFYEQSLEIQNVVPSNTPYPAGQDYYRYYNQTYSYIVTAPGDVKKFTEEKREGNSPIGNDPNNDDPANLLPVNQPSTNITPMEGAFPPYFANEVFYRLCSLNDTTSASPDIGLLMLPKIQDNKKVAKSDPKISNDFDGMITKEVIDQVKDIIKELSA